jgi:hypothetical protein
VTAMLWRNLVKNYRLALEAAIVVALVVGLRAVLFAAGLQGITATSLASSIIAGAVFVMALVLAGVLGDYRDAERAPGDLAAGLYAILRETESMHRVWGRPDLGPLRARLIEVVDALRRDIDDGGSRDCQAAVEDLSESLLELENTDVPANYIVRLRSEQAGLRKSVLRVYQIQREEFLPSAHAMITSFVVLVLVLLAFTKIGTEAETLITVAFLTFFFVYLLRLLDVISKPFKVGRERSDDDVSLFILYEFVVHARLADADLGGEEVVEIAERIEEQEAAVPDPGQTEGTGAAADEGPPPELEEVIDTAAAPVQDKEPEKPQPKPT